LAKARQSDFDEKSRVRGQEMLQHDFSYVIAAERGCENGRGCVFQSSRKYAEKEENEHTLLSLVVL
jgi:hypothetical protein